VTAFDASQTRDSTKSWLIELCRQPAWKAWAWAYAKQLEACPTKIWAGLTAEIEKAMKQT
jgi:hypothetical protein